MLSYSGLILLSLWSLFPILFVIITSFRPDLAGLASGNPFFFTPCLTNYINVIWHTDFFNYLSNTLVVSITASVVSVVSGLSAGYALARFKFKGSRIVAQGFLMVRLVPPITVVIPFFLMFSTLQLLDTSLGLILVYTVFLLPFSIWLFSSHIREVPVQSEEAAMADGLTRFEALCRVLIPQIRQAVTAVFMLNMVAAWNEFLFALILTSADAVTLPVAVSAFFGDRGVFWGRMAASGVLIMIFPILISIILHKTLEKGFAFRRRGSHD